MSTILHLGAGSCRELPGYLSESPERIVLVEPDPIQARDLQRRLRSESSVEVISVAVAAMPGTARLRRFQLQHLNSLRAPTGLFDLYPGLRLKDEIEVETSAPQALVESWDLQCNQGNRLVVDTPGEEFDIVHSLIESGRLSAFDRIDLHCGVTALYEGSERAESVLSLLEQEGYVVEVLDDITDADRPQWRLRRSALKLEVRSLQQRLAGISAERDSLRTRLADALAEIKKLEAMAIELRGLVSERERELAGASVAVEERTQLASELAARVDTVTRERDEAQAQSAQLQQDLEMERTRFREELSSLNERLSECAAYGNEQAALATKCRMDLDCVTKEWNEETSKVSVCQARIAELESRLAELFDAQGREVLLKDAVARAEAQIEVIRTVLLPGHGH